MLRSVRLPWIAILLTIAVGLSWTMTSSGNGSAASSRRPLRIALVLDPGGPQGAINLPAIPGLRRAIKELGVEGVAVTTTVKAGALPSLLSLGRQGYDLPR